MEYCNYPNCKCIVSTSSSQPEPDCPKGLEREPARSNSTTAIDDLGHIRAQIADLKKKEQALKQSVIELGEGAHEGELFRATVTETKRDVFDVAWAKKKLGNKQVAAHTRQTAYVTVTLTARTGEDLEMSED